jgi:hypothetical protein
MIHAYFECVTTEYPAHAGHGMLLVQLHGQDAGQPWTPDAARGMLRRPGQRGGLGKIIPARASASPMVLTQTSSTRQRPWSRRAA